MSESPGRKTSAMTFSVDARSENGHLGKEGLLRAFLHRDTQWPTGQPNIVKVNWGTFLWHMLDIIVMGACIHVGCKVGSIALIMLLLES